MKISTTAMRFSTSCKIYFVQDFINYVYDIILAKLQNVEAKVKEEVRYNKENAV